MHFDKEILSFFMQSFKATREIILRRLWYFFFSHCFWLMQFLKKMLFFKQLLLFLLLEARYSQPVVAIHRSESGGESTTQRFVNSERTPSRNG